MLLHLKYPLKLLVGGVSLPPFKTWARVNDKEYAHLRVGDTFDGAVIVRIEHDKEVTRK